MNKEFKEMLEEELSKFEKDKHRVSEIMNKVQNKTNATYKLVTRLFIILMVILLTSGILLQQISLAMTLQLCILLGVLKITWLLYETRQTLYFQFWILSSLDFQVTQLDVNQKKIRNFLFKQDSDFNKETNLSDSTLNHEKTKEHSDNLEEK